MGSKYNRKRPSGDQLLGSLFPRFEQQFLFPGQVRGFFVQIKHTASIGAKCDAAAVWGPHRAGIPSRIEGEPRGHPTCELIDPKIVARVLGIAAAALKCVAFRPARAPGCRKSRDLRSLLALCPNGRTRSVDPEYSPSPRLVRRLGYRQGHSWRRLKNLYSKRARRSELLHPSVRADGCQRVVPSMCPTIPAPQARVQKAGIQRTVSGTARSTQWSGRPNSSFDDCSSGLVSREPR